MVKHWTAHGQQKQINSLEVKRTHLKSTRTLLTTSMSIWIRDSPLKRKHTAYSTHLLKQLKYERGGQSEKSSDDSNLIIGDNNRGGYHNAEITSFYCLLAYLTKEFQNSNIYTICESINQIYIVFFKVIILFPHSSVFI